MSCRILIRSLRVTTEKAKPETRKIGRNQRKKFEKAYKKMKQNLSDRPTKKQTRERIKNEKKAAKIASGLYGRSINNTGGI